jgi:phage baseplate assembly protein W
MQNCCLIGDAYISDPTTSNSQELNIARLVTMQSLDQFNILIANLDESVPANVRTVNVRVNDTLVKIAARELGNFELWPSLAALNGLNPPYISANTGAGVVAVGAPLFIPTGQVSASTIYQPINMQLSYELDYLGTDIYLGPLSQQTMDTWTGDFATISGYNNLANALDRRLITPITALIYHPEYGSRIPGEIGNLQTQSVAGYLGAFAESAVTTDPRVASVTDLVVTFPQFGSTQISLTAIPNGNIANDVTVTSLIAPPASSNV